MEMNVRTCSTTGAHCERALVVSGRAAMILGFETLNKLATS